MRIDQEKEGLEAFEVMDEEALDGAELPLPSVPELKAKLEGAING